MRNAWPVTMYGCESNNWTRRRTGINSFEMKCLRPILSISRTERKTNERVLEAAGVERSLPGGRKRRKLSHFGPVLRKSGDCTEKEIIEGTVPCSRAQRRPTMARTDGMESSTDFSFDQFLKMSARTSSG